MRVKYLLQCGYDSNLNFKSAIFYYRRKPPFIRTIFESMDRMPDELPDTINNYAQRHRSNAISILRVLRPKSKLYDLHNEYHREAIQHWLNK